MIRYNELRQKINNYIEIVFITHSHRALRAIRHFRFIWISSWPALAPFFQQLGLTYLDMYIYEVANSDANLFAIFAALEVACFLEVEQCT